MPVIKADLALCQGYANCVVEAPDLFDIGDESTVVVLRQRIGPEERERAEEAARTCPVSALTVEDE
ncbi:MAG TPA: ferredoxin [Acidimicrobiales bacterium]|nr:ferredoxin [Acidimicrobiales bacterium]